MHYMNEFDRQRSIDRLARRAHKFPIALGAAHTLESFAEWVDAHSDGWAHWSPPVKAANGLMTLIEDAVERAETGDTFNRESGEWEDPKDTDPAALRKAYGTIRAFATRYNSGKYGNHNGSVLNVDNLICTVSFVEDDA